MSSRFPSQGSEGPVQTPGALTSGNGLLAGKVLVVIGATGGLGLSAVQAFLREGAKIVGVGRNLEKTIQAGYDLGPDVLTFSGDASHPDTSEKAIHAAIAKFGTFDGLYHVAGGSGRQWGDGPLHQLTTNAWEQTLNLNLNSIFCSNRSAVRAFLDLKKGGSILNMGSVLANSPSPHFFATHAYAAAKAAVEGITRSWAAYYAPYNIRFNAVLPGLMATPMSERAQSNPDIMNFLRTKQPLDGGRIGEPTDLDGAAIFFLSAASAFVTGQILSVDGGWSVTEGQQKPR